MPTSTFSVAASGHDGFITKEGTESEWPPTGTLTPNTNVGSDFGAMARKIRNQSFTFTEIAVAYFRWDTSALPDGATITSAILRLSVTGLSAAEARALNFEYYDFGATLEATDYVDNVGTTAASVASGTWQAWPTTGTVDVALSNLGNINKTGFTGIRVGVAGGQPAGSGDPDTRIHFAEFDHATRTEAQLIVTYSVAGEVEGAAVLSGTGSLVGAAVREREAAAAISGAGSLVAAGAIVAPTEATVPTLYIGIAFGYNPYDTSPVYTDVTSRVLSWSFERGRRTIFDSIDAARLTMELNNQDRALDPSFLGSPYAGQIKPGVRVVVDVRGERVYSGFIEAWPQTWDDLRNKVTVTALDLFDTFNVDMIPGTVYAVEKSGSRIIAGLAEIGVPSAWYAGVNTGIDDVQAHTAGEEDNWLEHFKKVAVTEQGYLFQDRTGLVKFYQRHALSLPPFTDVQATFANFPGGGEFMLSDVDDPDYSVRDIKNDVRVTREGGATSRAFDATSIAEYRKRTHQVTTIHDSTTTPADLATWILGLYKDPKLRPDGVTIHPQADPSMYPYVLQRELADRVRLRIQPPGPTGLIDLELAIQSIAMSMGEDRKLEVKWNLAPPTGASQIWRLGTDLLGVSTYLGF
jgi:hypothetical protein